MAKLSREFLEEAWRRAKKDLPGWVYASILAAARPSAGGQAGRRDDEPSKLESLGLARLNKDVLKKLEDIELVEIWEHLHKWFVNAKKRKRDTARFLSIASDIHTEIKTRKIKIKSTILLSELEQIAKGVPCLLAVGPENAVVAFVGASPGVIEMARQEPFVGPVQQVLKAKYWNPLGLKREDVALLYVCPELLVDSKGKTREPTNKEADFWKPLLFDELDRLNPNAVVALGRVAKRVLGKRADLVLPHPLAVERFGDSGEITRKLRRIKKQNTEGGAQTAWDKNWPNWIPKSGKGKFVYMHHWRGLSEDEAKTISDEQLMDTDHSVHGDLRLEGDDKLFGWTVFLGRPSANKGRDKLFELKPEGSLRLSLKPQHDKAWLEVGGELRGQSMRLVRQVRQIKLILNSLLKTRDHMR